VTRLGGLSHHVEHGRVLGHVEVEVDLHAPVVHMARHGVPEAARLELGHAHEELAGRQHVGNQELVDRAAVARFGRSQRLGRRFCQGHLLVRVGGVRRRAVEVELGWKLRVDRLEGDVLRALPNVERLARADVELHAVRGDPRRAADVDQPQLATLQEEVGAGVASEFRSEAHRGRHRMDAANDDAIDLAVGEGGRVGLEQVFDQKVATQALGVERAGVFAVNGLADLHDLSAFCEGREGLPEVRLREASACGCVECRPPLACVASARLRQSVLSRNYGF
jgi:hypothetical protein